MSKVMGGAGYNYATGMHEVAMFYWDPNAAAYVRAEVPTVSGGQTQVTNFPETYAVTGAFYQTTQPVSGPVTDAQLRATPVPISGTVTVDTSLLATTAKQDIANTSLASIDTKLTAPLVKGLVSDGLPDSTADGTYQSLSLTKQGRVRVATVVEDMGVSFFQPEQMAQWGESPSLTYESPWGL